MYLRRGAAAGEIRYLSGIAEPCRIRIKQRAPYEACTRRDEQRGRRCINDCTCTQDDFGLVLTTPLLELGEDLKRSIAAIEELHGSCTTIGKCFEHRPSHVDLRVMEGWNQPELLHGNQSVQAPVSSHDLLLSMGRMMPRVAAPHGVELESPRSRRRLMGRPLGTRFRSVSAPHGLSPNC